MTDTRYTGEVHVIDHYHKTTCKECGAWISDEAAHDAWHDEIQLLLDAASGEPAP
jgi:hypothetical protein